MDIREYQSMNLPSNAFYFENLIKKFKVKILKIKFYLLSNYTQESLFGFLID